MKITESRLRQIIRETYTEVVAPPRRKITVQDVDAVLSALTTGPLWDPVRVEEVAEGAAGLARKGWGEWVLSGIKGWIENEQKQNEMGKTTPGFARALELIKTIARRERISIVGSDESLAGSTQETIDWAYTRSG